MISSLVVLLALSVQVDNPAAKVAWERPIGGSRDDYPAAVAVDDQGSVYITGTTRSADFPTTTGALRRRIPNPPLLVSNDGGSTFSTPDLGAAPDVVAISGTADGRTLYAASTAGVYRSSDGGDTWLRTAAPFAAVAIAADPRNSAVAWAGARTGVFRTDDGGATWTDRTAGLRFDQGITSVRTILVDPHASTVYVATNGPQWIHRSTDGGLTWKRLSPIDPASPESAQPVTAIALDPQVPGVLYVSAVARLFRSADGGETWSGLADGPVSILAVDPGDSEVIWAIANVLRRSTDGGRTFAAVAPDTMMGLEAIAIDPAQPAHIVVRGSMRAYLSTDGGQTWSVLGQGRTFTAAYPAAGRWFLGARVQAAAFVTKLDRSGNLVYSTYLGQGLYDYGTDIAVGRDGTAYIIGTAFTGETTTGFLARLSADGTRLIASAQLGQLSPNGVAVDTEGNAYVTGEARPMTSFAPVPGMTAGECTRAPEGFSTVRSENQAFLMKLAPDGSTVYARSLPSSCGGSGLAITLQTNGRIWLAGKTYSPDLPVTPSAVQKNFGTVGTSGFIAALGPNGDRLDYLSYVGGGYYGEASTIALDPQGQVLVGGQSAEFPVAPSAEFPGSGPCPWSVGIGPTPPASAGVAFALKFYPAWSGLAGLASLGTARCGDAAQSVLPAPDGTLWLAAGVQSRQLPTLAPFRGYGYGFLARLSSDASRMLFSTYLESVSDMALGADGALFLAGSSTTESISKLRASDTESLASVLVMKLEPAPSPAVALDAVTHSSALLGYFEDAVAPGEIVRLRGRNIGPELAVGGQVDTAGRLATTLAGTQVFFDGVPVPLLAVQATEVVAIAPVGLAGKLTGVQVEYQGQRSNTVQMPVTGAPLTAPLAVSNQDFSPNLEQNPARPGSVVTFWMTGLGQTDPPIQDGAVNRQLGTLLRPLGEARILGDSGSVPIAVEYAGPAPGQVAGYYQVNLRLPDRTYSDGRAVIYLGSIPTVVYVK